jgi:outer membrane protein assembly factor BamB
MVTAEATPEEFREISSAEVLSGRCWTVPVLAQGRIYCRNAAGDLVALEARPQ